MKQAEFKYISLFLVLMGLLASCAVPPNISRKECVPPPTPECRPGLSDAIGIDTSRVQPGYFKYHIDLLPSPINSDENEIALS
ncbi:MAG: hypothetical protein ABI778_10260, partial [Ignavibacteriota bacterium]